jgi:threonine/homoserine/homoserine lactone efflux protein
VFDQSFILFLIANITISLAPGPDMLYTITRSVAQGKSAGIASALGIALGCFFHIFATAFGLSAVLNTTPILFEIIKYCGAAYLIYLGIMAIIYRKESIAEKQISKDSISKIFWQGALTNVLNPKVALFFLAFLPQFVNSQNESAISQLLFLGIVFNTLGTLVNLSVAVIASKAGNWMKQKISASEYFNLFTGFVFIGLAVKLAFTKK